MKILFYNIYEELNKNNFLFENNNVNIGDDLLAPMLKLKEYANLKDIEVGTTDLISVDEADAIVFIDMPKVENLFLKSAIKSRKPLYLLALESPLVSPESYNEVNHKLFKKVFTWHDDFIKIDNNKYIKINYTYDLPSKIPKDINKKIKLCCMISGNKKLNYSNELYSERLNAIRWFEKNHLIDFDLYGIGWDEVSSGENRYISYILRRVSFLKKIFATKHLSYKGKVDRKKPVLEKYKFSICYENVKDIPGYISEKIFDCFFAGCVPIYLGANNVIDYIPKDCFIDKRDFKSYEELYIFLDTINDKDYLSYLENINKFLLSEKSNKFTTTNFAQTIIKELVK